MTDRIRSAGAFTDSFQNRSALKCGDFVGLQLDCDSSPAPRVASRVYASQRRTLCAAACVIEVCGTAAGVFAAYVTEACGTGAGVFAAYGITVRVTVQCTTTTGEGIRLGGMREADDDA